MLLPNKLGIANQDGDMMGLFDFLRKKPLTVLDVLQSNPAFQEQKKLYDLMAQMCEDGVDADELPNGVGEFGASPENPIPCKTVFGSTSYLARLRTADGTKVVYERRGSFGSNVTPHPVDGYDISHPDGRMLAMIYISPYQKRNSRKAPTGFFIAS